jgi:nucleotide-binding universal stress UspA family protein
MLKRYKHLLVPLDGSELAELALADALSIAQLSQAEITFLQVVPPIEQVLGVETGYPIFVDQQWGIKKTMALEYLQGICERLDCPNLTMHTIVELGPPAETIIDYACQYSIDLIVMATHGRSGLQRWVYGSVADKVLRGADLPVLLVRAHTPQEAPK